MLTPNSIVIATYTERLPQVYRVFRLYSDRVEIVAKWTIGKNYQTTIPLVELSRSVTYFTIKNRWFYRAISVAGLSVASASAFHRHVYPDLIRHIAVICWPIALAALVVAVISFPKRRFVRFQQKSGKPGLDICAVGSQDRFDSFVSELRQCIIRSKRY